MTVETMHEPRRRCNSGWLASISTGATARRVKSGGGGGGADHFRRRPNSATTFKQDNCPLYPGSSYAEYII